MSASLELEQKCIDTVRLLSVDMVQQANSGHPGAPMGCAPMVHVLFNDIMKYNPTNPNWFDRDRFVLSNGHSCAMYYAILHLTGYAVSIDDLKAFRQVNSITPGHPENFMTPGVEVSTGPLGQGITNAVGMAMAERHLAAVYNRGDKKLMDHYTFVICGDGCLQEGISSEASSIAGHHGLGKLIVLYDDNNITIDGDTSLTFTEDVTARYLAYGWQVLSVADGNDVAAIREAVQTAKLEINKPTIIRIKTVIGFGSVNAGTEKVHGAPLGVNDVAAVKTKFGFDPKETFSVDESVRQYYLRKKMEGQLMENDWKENLSFYSTDYPDLATEFLRRMRGELHKIDWNKIKPEYTHLESKAAGTRNRSGEVLNALAVELPEIVGGSADLTLSNNANLLCSGAFQKETPEGRAIYFGVREHAMVAICNGMFAHGGIRPYCATFLNFLGYALGAVRVSALSRFGVIFIATHDSIGLGEDGPTHQPTEMLDNLRSTPNLYCIRPADGKEVIGSYQVALERKTGPTVISLSRQATPTLEGTSAELTYSRGGYTVKELRSEGAESLPYPTLTMISTGTELAMTVDAATLLFAQLVGDTDSAVNNNVWIRVVSMPCCELFLHQSIDYQKTVLMAGSPTMAIEASSVLGWKRFAHAVFGLDDCFGKSAPANDLYEYFGFTPAKLAKHGREVVEFYLANKSFNSYSNGNISDAHPSAPSLLDYPRFPQKNRVY